MTPEINVLIVAGAVIAFAYTVIYSRMTVKTLDWMIRLDLGVTTALLVALVIEVPFFYFFCKRWGIDMMPPPEI